MRLLGVIITIPRYCKYEGCYYGVSSAISLWRAQFLHPKTQPENEETPESPIPTLYRQMFSLCWAGMRGSDAKLGTYNAVWVVAPQDHHLSPDGTRADGPTSFVCTVSRYWFTTSRGKRERVAKREHARD